MFDDKNEPTDWPKTITITVAVVMFTVFVPLAVVSLFLMMIGLDC